VCLAARLLQRLRRVAGRLFLYGFVRLRDLPQAPLPRLLPPPPVVLPAAELRGEAGRRHRRVLF
jgi:hypothetical protein